MSEPQAHARTGAHWVPSPLLLRPQETPRFLRAPWDAQRADSFGPWRVTARVDPALPLEQGPAAEPPSGSPGAVALAEDIPALPGPEGTSEPPQIADAVPGISPEMLAEAEARAFARGREEGREQALSEVEADRAREAEVLRHLTIELRALKEDSDRFFEPLRRLALHIAEQLVRAELSASPEAVSQIVRQCLSALDDPSEGVVVSLNPEDAAMLEAARPSFLENLRLQPEPALHRGSVRLRMDDTLLEDLIENRLDAIAQRLLAQPRRAGESVLVRDAFPVESFPAEPVDAPPRRPRSMGDVIDAAAFPVRDDDGGDALGSDLPGLQAIPEAWKDIDLNLGSPSEKDPE